MLDDRQKETLKKLLGDLPHEVKLVYFTQENECPMCQTTREILEAVAGITPKVTVEVHDFVADAELARQYGIDKIPGFAVLGERDYGLRFYGLPAGYEFTSLVDTVVAVGRRQHGLPEPLAEEIRRIDRPVHLQVMVTLTCPYCPRAVLTAHRFAMLNEQIRSDMVEISEFPHLAVRYDVQGVPVTLINETHPVVGAVPPAHLLQGIRNALEQAPTDPAPAPDGDH